MLARACRCVQGCILALPEIYAGVLSPSELEEARKVLTSFGRSIPEGFEGLLGLEDIADGPGGDRT